jgi:hypothetical protein
VAASDAKYRAGRAWQRQHDRQAQRGAALAALPRSDKFRQITTFIGRFVPSNGLHRAIFKALRYGAKLARTIRAGM